MNIVAQAVTALSHARQQLGAPEGASGSELAAGIRAGVKPLSDLASDIFGPMSIFETEVIPTAVDLAEHAATLVQSHEGPFATSETAAPIADISKAIDLLTGPQAYAIGDRGASPFSE